MGNKRKISDVKARVRGIQMRSDANDFEAAHIAEDQLYLDVLQAIADGKCSDPSKLAATAILSRNIQFARYTS